MLPASYQLPAALVLLLGGIVACFFGYRLFRLVLAIVGFVLGAALATSVVGPGSSWSAVAVAVGGGLVGAMALFAAYYVGVALLGAALGVVVGNLAFAAGTQEPHLVMVILCAVAGAILAMFLQRYVITTGTAFGGAWTILVGGLALVGDPTAAYAAASGHVWIVYPLDPGPDRQWLPVAWVVLGVVGTVVQLGWTGRGGGRRR